jgi:hypothetical protein
MIRAAALPLLAIVSCETIVSPTQVVTITPPGHGQSPPPAVGVFDEVSVEVFDTTCPAPPRFIPGCIARITATPKLRGVMVPPEVHGPSCRWFLDGGLIAGVGSTPVVQASNTPAAFNVNVVALQAGSFRLEAQVGTVTGAKTFVVVQ